MYILPNLKGKEIIMYLRKSRSDDPLATVAEVLEKHEQMLDEWVEHAPTVNSSIPEENRFREVVSGETLDSRPKMQELLRRIESPDVKAVLVKEPSRLSRGDLQDIGYLVKVLMYTGTLVLTLQGAYDLRDDRDREQFERELMRGGDYLHYQKKIMADGKHLAVKNGCFIGSLAPYGYKKISIKVGRQTCHTLEPIPEEAEVVRRIFELYRAGKGTLHICDVLDAEHAPPPKGKIWAHTTVTRILQNIHYIGKVTWYRSKWGHKVEDGEVIKYRYLSDDYYIYDGLHPAIIDQELWDDVQTIRGKIPAHKKGTTLLNPLAGVMYCAACGKAMSLKQTRHKGKDVGAPRFRCGSGRCRESGSALVSEVMAEIIKVLRVSVDDFKVRLEQGADNSAEEHRKTIERLEKRLEALRDLETRQWDEKIKGDIPDHIFERLNSKTVADIEEITQALVEAEENAPEHIDIHERIVTLESTIALLEDPDAPVKDVNDLVKQCIKRIVYSRPKKESFKGKKGNMEPFKLEIDLRL